MHPWAYFWSIREIQEGLYSGAGAARREDEQRKYASSIPSRSLKTAWTLRAEDHLLFLLCQTVPTLSTPCFPLSCGHSGTHWLRILCSTVKVDDGRVLRTVCLRPRCLVSMMSTFKTHGITPTSVIDLVAAYKLTCQCIQVHINSRLGFSLGYC